jgi:ribosomal-protein-alanine N-acetyltransferase
VLRGVDRCRRLLDHGGVITVAREQGGIVGFVAFSVVLAEATMMNLVVAEAVRRRGIARKLLRHSLAALAARGVARVLLEVRASNLAAIGLYRALGFHEDGLRRSYYPARGALPAEDAMLMSLALTFSEPGGERNSPCG